MKTIIVVGHTEIDGFGNLQVTDKEGKVTKIAAKREKLHPLFQQGHAVELDWQTYMDKDYVADAKLVGDALAVGSAVPAVVVSSSKEESTRVFEKPEPSGQEIGMTVKEIGDMIRAGEISKLFGAKIGAELITWYRGRIISTTRTDYDSKDLPSIKPKEE